MVSAVRGRCVGDTEEGASCVDGSQISVCWLNRDLAVGAGSQVGGERHRVSMGGGKEEAGTIA